MGRTRKPPEEVSQARRQAVMRRHHPELSEETTSPQFGDGEQSPLPGACVYDGVVQRPQTYNDAVQREKAIAEEIQNEIRREDALIRRGKLFSEKQIRERDDSWSQIVLNRIDDVQRLIDSVEGLSPEQRKSYLDGFKKWRAETRLELTTRKATHESSHSQA